MSDMVKETGTAEFLGGGGGVEGTTVDTKSIDSGDGLNSATSGSDGSSTTESLPPATLDNGLPGGE